MLLIIVVTNSLTMEAFASSSANQVENVAMRWDSAALEGVRNSKLGAPMASRAIAIVHTCMYDAWAAYDDRATGTQLRDALRRPLAERTLANKEEAASYAAYRALADVLGSYTQTIYAPLMRQLGYHAGSTTTDIETPAGIGNVACDAVLEYRHHDKSNQLGDLAQGAYSDWTSYTPTNKPRTVSFRGTMADPNRWQPLVYVNSTGELVTQQFLAAHWCFVTPFALTGGEEWRGVLQALHPADYGSKQYQTQADELVALSARLTDEQKTVAEYWLDGPNSEQPPGHWMRFAQWISKRDHHTLDDDVKMFFALSNALFDTGIAAWDEKRAYDSVRPASAIPFLFNGQRIRAWGGPGRGTIEMDGAQWIPYQPTSFPTPPFPDFVSGHSAFSAAAASIFQLLTWSNRFGYSVTFPAGGSKIEPGVTPAHPLVLRWDTFTSAADQAGMSRRYGGIHFERADLAGRLLGRLVATQVWAKCEGYFNGTALSVAGTTDSADRTLERLPAQTSLGYQLELDKK